MDQSTFDAVDPLLEDIADIVDATLTSDQLSALRNILAQLSKTIGERYSVSLNVIVEIFDRERVAALPLLNMGLSASEGEEPFQTWGDSSLQRYIVDGQIQVVPHDRCPKCWEPWAFKFENRGCPHCDATLGGNCKILLDSDICPNCEQGKVSIAEPICDKCSFKADPTIVVWG
jgi:hypothetical protein